MLTGAFVAAQASGFGLMPTGINVSNELRALREVFVASASLQAPLPRARASRATAFPSPLVSLLRTSCVLKMRSR